jgi:hypothetical protein
VPGFAYGSPPFGFRAEAGQLIPDEREQGALVRMRALRAEGRSLREIGRVLETAPVLGERRTLFYPEPLCRQLRSQIGLHVYEHTVWSFRRRGMERR